MIEFIKSVIALIVEYQNVVIAFLCAFMTILIMQVFIKSLTTSMYRGVSLFKKEFKISNTFRSRLNVVLAFVLGWCITSFLYEGPKKQLVVSTVAVFNPLVWWGLMIWIEYKAEEGNKFLLKVLAKLKPWRVKKGVVVVDSNEKKEHPEFGGIKEYNIPGSMEDTIMIRTHKGKKDDSTS